MTENLVNPLVYQFGRVKHNLRILVTDRCDLSCVYCMPDEPQWKKRSEILTYEEIVYLAWIFVRDLGIEKIRITGGEPIIRKDLPNLVERLASLKDLSLKRLSLTTNGTQLKTLAANLKAVGLDDINVSLDSLEASKFYELAKGSLDGVLDGIEEAKRAGLKIKINSVIVRGMNDDEVMTLVKWAYGHGISLRFIEFMLLDGRGIRNPKHVFSEEEILEDLRKEFDITPVEENSNDPARHYLLNGSYKLGIISTIPNPFCSGCDRVRLTAAGKLLPCLFSLNGADLKALVRTGASEKITESAIRDCVFNKPTGFVNLGKSQKDRDFSMHAIGG